MMMSTQILPKSRPTLQRAVLILLGGMLLLAAAPGEEAKKSKEYGLIFGTVWGPDNRPVYGVRVRIRRATEKKPQWELYSDHNGEFAQRVPAQKADYVIWVEAKDLKSLKNNKLKLSEPVPVHVEYDERVDVGVHLTK